ncbi:ATP-dependent DNA ligase [Luteimicrobium xylanilyticum]|uniref:Probable DNA ligase n=1 Tax=Luteimicrobium xylanilyticum TaxID=1133546 RepID=A0A5P9Q5T9_9MICO|nr:ATP-dependent DNA ligase [Luteimicrobium xylanilyticum]QFU96626.1 DNA ligase (ATP) [Luteimicrobium xylanilyticum]
MLLDDVAATSEAVAATRSRLAKRASIAALLRRAAEESPPGRDPGPGPDEVVVVTSYLAGELRQRRTGLGWASLRSLPAPATEPTLTVATVDAAFERMAGLSGPGSDTARAAEASALFGAATEREQRFLRGLVAGELRQGALDAVVVDAIAEASGAPVDVVRRAVMLRGDTGAVAVAALRAPDPGAAGEALGAFGLEVGRPVRPMLAQSAPDVATALEKLGPDGAEVSVDTKLDGIRIQVHRAGDAVRVFTRSLDDITPRVPEIVAAALALDANTFVLDGEALAVDASGTPRPFQETASRSASQEAEALAAVELTPFFFDALHVDGRDLLDDPLRDRLAVLDGIAGPFAVGRLVTGDPDAAAAFFTDAVARGQEGVVVKALDAPYAAGRRGAGWVKVKPRHTLDLVVLAVERGSGRRQGHLSNIHLGARDSDGGFVMLGKTFKGMTDQMLAWQTERFTELADGPTDGYVVKVRPEQVVEIAFDGVQRSTRYPGGVALRFARVIRYRDDKTAAEADTIDTVRSYAAG